MVGYDNQLHFSRAFKAIYGVPPRAPPDSIWKKGMLDGPLRKGCPRAKLPIAIPLLLL